MGIIETKIKNAFEKFKENGNLYELIRKLLIDTDYSVRFAWQLSTVLDALKKHCPLSIFECVFYDGENNGIYRLLDFNPNQLDNKTLKEKIKTALQYECHIDSCDIDKFMDSIYLINTNTMIKVK